MTKATLAKINAHIKGRDLDLEFVKGNGYFYFMEGDNWKGPPPASIYVCYLNQMPLDKWIQAVDWNINEALAK